METILGGIATAASGGIFGLLGSAIGAGFKFFQSKQQNKFEEKKWAYEKDMIDLNMKARAAETEHELAIVAQQGSFIGLGKSIDADSKLTRVHMVVNDIRALFRPFLTTGLVIMVYIIFRNLLDAFGNADGVLAEIFTNAEIKEILQYIVYSMVFAATTAVVWWFGDRAFAPPGSKNR